MELCCLNYGSAVGWAQFWAGLVRLGKKLWVEQCVASWLLYLGEMELQVSLIGLRQVCAGLLWHRKSIGQSN